MQDLQLDDSTADDRALFRLVEVAGSSSWRVAPTDHTRGPWDHVVLHGGPVCGLAGWAAEHLGGADGLLCGRLTVELLAAVPLAPLLVTATTAKPGRRSRVVDVAITADDRLVARASSQWLRPSVGWTSGGSEPPPRPDVVADPGSADIDYPRPGFNCDAAEFRYLSGSNEESGPGVVWARLTSPVVAGLPTSPFAATAALADLAAAVGWERGPDDASYINADVTLQLTRPPKGPWLAFDAGLVRSVDGLGFNRAVLHDDHGPIGQVLQSLVESPITL